MTTHDQIEAIITAQQAEAQKLLHCAERSRAVLHQLPEHILAKAACVHDWLQLSNLTQAEAEEVRALVPATSPNNWECVKSSIKTQDWQGTVDGLTIKLIGVQIDSNAGHPVEQKYRMLEALEIVQEGDHYRETTTSLWRAVEGAIGGVMDITDVGLFRRPIKNPAPLDPRMADTLRGWGTTEMEVKKV